MKRFLREESWPYIWHVYRDMCMCMCVRMQIGKTVTSWLYVPFCVNSRMCVCLEQHVHVVVCIFMRTCTHKHTYTHLRIYTHPWEHISIHIHTTYLTTYSQHTNMCSSTYISLHTTMKPNVHDSISAREPDYESETIILKTVTWQWRLMLESSP